ncbi:MAG: nucleotidyltransferase [Terriglobales bacterium]
MARDWKAIFDTWTKPASDGEALRQANAEGMIRDALRDYDPLRVRSIKVIAQGSYRNNTNVRAESDVDICVCCMEPFFYDYTFADYTMQESNVVAAPYIFSEFKNDVEAALVKKFGRAGVFRGTKAFDVHANTYRVDADVVAAFAHRRYQKKIHNLMLVASYIYPYTEPEGTQFVPDGGGSAIVNWPEQHYSNGVAKNKATGYRFKSVVRALKNLKYEMEALGDAAQKRAAKEAPSYLVECLVYNVENLDGNSYYDTVRNVIIVAYDATKAGEICKGWLEVNRMKWLFHPMQPWTREQANAFLLEAWRYAEFK